MPRSPAANCPYRAPSAEANRRTCEALEYFNVTSLTPKGYVEWNGRRAAFIEEADGRLHAIRRGGYLARNFGKVMAISRDAIDLREIIQNKDDVWQEARADLRYGVTPEPSQAQPLDYIEEGSVQGNYNKAVNELFLFNYRVVGVANHCKLFHPETAAGVDEALVSWRNQYANTLEEIERHSQAYAGRVAVDYGVSQSLVIQNARRNASKKLDEFLDNIGLLGSTNRRAYCEGYPSLLRSQASNPQMQFATEFKLLDSCKETWTCPNVREVSFERQLTVGR